ncbi:CRP/FNR family transcriptional regulator/CRP/FNR family nitrogen fixation transcriptional regulator [Litoreibacter ponti]|uniref:CRP/FNR family transcriptional regulator/CRP/FNR family nitrogen fixation transcriptional regulator n=1 Tax=Litoreibacter ponti TaxID=1510457 RepID=A0A2T6BCS5_9RHOB|nr:helix-turn-helix domain-containing protein [Litoreibacter ponti]PTX53826.1 CRP/FNR family transcriptional regulator/CRP/FNR family nitrogen fixation transcriptional regulator [Litoreibacter ponti]
MYVTSPCEVRPKLPVAPLASSTYQATETRLKPGAYLYFEGDEVEWLYQVTSGVLRLTRLLADGRRQVIAFGLPGDTVGFPAAGLHHTDCEALTDVRLQPFRRAHLENGEGDPKLHTALLQAALREISAMQDHFMMLGRKSATEKVASFLCVLSERVGENLGAYRQVKLPMSRSDIADFLGLTTETVSRTLTQLRKSQIIAIDSIHTVIIQRPEALLNLAEGSSD